MNGVGPEMKDHSTNARTTSVQGDSYELQELEAQIRKLTLKDRATLAKWIVESLDDLSASEIEALWVDEAGRRLDELEQGLVAEIPAEEVLRRARATIS
jgi:putative addiction module component (TIGR02574 family)